MKRPSYKFIDLLDRIHKKDYFILCFSECRESLVNFINHDFATHYELVNSNFFPHYEIEKVNYSNCVSLTMTHSSAALNKVEFTSMNKLQFLEITQRLKEFPLPD